MISTYEIIMRLLIGAIFGGIIGFERSTHGRPAGFRTHLLVCVASVLIMIVSEYYYYLSLIDPSYIRIDPVRLAAGAVTGVGFLGAGVIIKTGLSVQGLTTAACLWVVSAIGLAVGSGLYIAGTVGFVITYLSLWLLRMIEDRMPRLSYKFLHVVMHGEGDEEAVTSVVGKHNSTISNINYERDLEKEECVFDITIASRDRLSAGRILREISSVQNVKKVAIRN
ncbi:MAG: MgtC/SapB family protein [Nitrospirae bacterium]|nr:MgtC/SapB family protein [Nitrospirota bacterium]